MDQELDQLEKMIYKKREESSLTIKWAAVIGIIVVVCGGLFGGFVSNSQRLTRLEERYDFVAKSIAKMEQSQSRVESLVNEIYYTQKQKYKDRKNAE